MKIKIITVGKTKSTDPIMAMINEYLKQIRWKIEFIEIENSLIGSIDKIKEKEGELIISKIKPTSYVIALEPKGELFSSQDIASTFQNLANNNLNEISFIIGGSHGLCNTLLQKASLKLSFGKITLPHKLARLVLTEQIYRSWCILNNKQYDK